MSRFRGHKQGVSVNNCHSDHHITKGKVSLQTNQVNITLSDLSIIPNDVNDLKCLFLNIRSLKAKYQNGHNTKFDELKDICAQIPNLSFICICETWLSEADTKFFKIQNYSDYHFTRKEGERGGGVTCYVNNNLTCLSCDKIGDIAQILLLKIKIKNSLFNLIICYNPNINTIDICLEDLSLILAACKNGTTFIVGDLNVNILERTNQRNILTSWHLMVIPSTMTNSVPDR